MTFDRQLNVLGRRPKAELVEYVIRAFMGVDGARRFVEDEARLRAFVWQVSRLYRNNPYHNFQHAVDTTNAMAWMVTRPGLSKRLPDLYVFVLILAALVHDLEHPGTDNQWEIKTRSRLAEKYRNEAVLENRSLDGTFDLLQDPECALLAGLPPDTHNECRRLLGLVIIATDFATHQAFLKELRTHLHTKGTDFSDPEGLSLLARTLIKAADISNTTKEFPLARLWGRRVMREYWAQGRREKRRGLPVGPLNDPDKVAFHEAQAEFIETQVQPLFDMLVTVESSIGEAAETLTENRLSYLRRSSHRTQ